MNHPGLTGGQWALLIGSVVVLLILRGMVALVKSGMKQVTADIIFIWVWRHFTGQHYHGKRVTDATWLSHGTTTTRKHNTDGFMSRWEHKPPVHRALWRLGVTAAGVAAVYGLITEWTVTVNAVKSLGVYLAVSVIFICEAKWVLRVHTRHIITPCAKSLAPVMRLSPHAVRRMIHIKPDDISDEGEIGYMELPDEITPSTDMQSTIERIFDAHLPVDSEMEWQMLQAPRIGVIRASQKPPDDVMWNAMIARMDACQAGEVFIGLDKAKDPYTASLTDQEDPHWGFDVNTKFGKSNFLGITVAQILHQDPQARAFIVDPKRSSLIDFVGSPLTPSRPLLPGIMMANNPRRPDDMWDVIRAARALLEHRSEEAELNRGKRFPCALVIIDELNQFGGDLMKDHWNDLKAADKRLPKDQRECLDGIWPGWADIMAILRMGRFVNMHVLACAQDFRDDAFGGKGGRNYLGFKGMAGFGPTQWDKFIGKKPTPIMQNHPGRWIFSDGHTETWVQVVFADAEHDRAAYDYASHGRELYVDEMHDVSVHHADTRSLPASYLQEVTDTPALEVPDRMAIVGIPAAADYLGYNKIASFDKARMRYKQDHKIPKGQPILPGEFRSGRQPAWYADDLDAWKNSRPGSKED